MIGFAVSLTLMVVMIVLLALWVMLRSRTPKPTASPSTWEGTIEIVPTMSPAWAPIPPAMAVMLREWFEGEVGLDKLVAAVEQCGAGDSFTVEQWTGRPWEGGTRGDRLLVERGNETSSQWNTKVINDADRSFHTMTLFGTSTDAQVVAKLMEWVGAHVPRVRW